MTDRYTAYLAIVAARDAALLQLAGLCLTGLVSWWGIRFVFSEGAQNRVIAIAGIAFYLTLMAILFGGF
jgi:hypothetical protein